ncbi:putative bifunctional diguanylate cyclase/phosphodiesterase [Litchfieldia alkalitelluris]|uniref:putative bifunctional diguanylate cyclase/phosphodiesterase n=1 Tax=Litchfieldia alkalitelluris TaxID=304268 RepID=UPI00195C15F1|nr:EAL domain-containing protein [Litchfieldia alkalitelluris]
MINPLVMSFGTIFNLASLFLLLILWLYGFKVAFYSMVIITGISIYLSGITPTNIQAVLEILFFAFIFWLTPKGNSVLWGVIFWVVVGAPISSLIYLNFFGVELGNLLFFQVTTDVINGVFNIWIFDMLISYVPFHKWIRGGSKPPIQIKKLLFHLSFAAMLIPFMIYVSINSWGAICEYQNGLISSVESKVKQISLEMKSWSEEDLMKLRLNGRIQMGYLEEMITNLSEGGTYELVVTEGKENIIISSNPKINMEGIFALEEDHIVTSIAPSFSAVLPNEDRLWIKNWGNGFYLYESNIVGSINMYVKIPLAHFQDRIFKDLLQQFVFLILFLVMALIFSSVLHRLLARTLDSLAITTTGLPNKINQLESVVWPTSNISEIHSLIYNFQTVFSRLKDMFYESRLMNDRLRSQAEMLQTSEKKLHELAFFDSLTSLPNRQYFQESLTEAIRNAEAYEQKVAILFLDLDQFKQVNDTLGHVAGDELLIIVSSMLKKVESEKVQLYRLSGDEFVMIMTHMKDQKEVCEIALKIKAMFEKPIIIRENLLHVSSSIGISMFPEDGRDKEVLIQNADIAMYRSKAKAGTTVEFFNNFMRIEFQDKVNMTHELRIAESAEQFELVYQPKVNQNNHLTSMEALIRWHNSRFGTVNPGIFIPLAEDAGLIKKIDEWALNEACKQNKKWQDEGYRKVKVSVNISAKHFSQGSLVDMVREALNHSKLEAKYLQLELTESVFIDNIIDVIEILKEIREMGVFISIDDFGKGFSSLSHLNQLPLTEIKLDKDFVRDINADSKKGMIVRYIVDMAKQLSFNVVVEGVETIEELHYLNEVGCNEMQGYLFSKPVSKDVFEQLLNSKNPLI